LEISKNLKNKNQCGEDPLNDQPEWEKKLGFAIRITSSDDPLTCGGKRQGKARSRSRRKRRGGEWGVGTLFIAYGGERNKTLTTPHLFTFTLPVAAKPARARLIPVSFYQKPGRVPCDVACFIAVLLRCYYGGWKSETQGLTSESCMLRADHHCHLNSSPPTQWQR